MPTGRHEDGQWMHAGLGQLRVCDAERAVICHVCGAALAHLSAQHVAGHGLTLIAYRERFGLNRQQALMSPATVEQRRLEGHRRLQLPQVAAGLEHGQRMARSGELLSLSHAAQPRGTASAQRRDATRRALAQARDRQRQDAAAGRDRRARELGFDDVPTYLRARSAAGASAWSMARELRCGNAKTIRRLLVELDNTASAGGGGPGTCPS